MGRLPKIEAADAGERPETVRPRARRKFEPGRLKLSVIEARRPLTVTSLHDQLVARLREMVLDGELAPASPLPEKMLCDTFGVSRTPLREAFKVLATEGLVVLRPHRTPMVAPVDPAEVAAAFEVVATLDELAARLACVRADAADIAALDARHARLTDLVRDGNRRDYFRANQEIHAEIVRLAGNPVLAATWGALTTRIHRARAQANSLGGRSAESLAEHEIFMGHLRRRDGEAFAAALGDHTRRTGRAVLAALAALADTTGAPTPP